MVAALSSHSLSNSCHLLGVALRYSRQNLDQSSLRIRRGMLSAEQDIFNGATWSAFCSRVVQLIANHADRAILMHLLGRALLPESAKRLS